MRRRIIDMLAYPRAPRDSYEHMRASIRVINVPSYGDINYVVACPYAPLQRRNLTIVYCHGRDETIPLTQTLAQNYANYFCANVLYFDYFGYGETAGHPSEASTNAAMVEVVAEAKRMNPDDRIIAWGRSIGSCPACFAIDMVDLCVVESGLASAQRVLFESNRIFCMDGFNNTNRIAYSCTPVILVHGTDDEVVPYRCSIHNFKVAAQTRFPKKTSRVFFDSKTQNQFVYCGNIAHLSVFGRGHNDMNANEAMRTVLFYVRDFIAEQLATDMAHCLMKNLTVKKPRDKAAKSSSRFLVE